MCDYEESTHAAGLPNHPSARFFPFDHVARIPW